MKKLTLLKVTLLLVILFTACQKDDQELDKTPPTIEIISPEDNSSYNIGEAVNIQVSASDDIELERIEFYVNDKLVFTDLSVPYLCEYVLETDGSHVLNCKAYDVNNNFSISEPVEIKVNTPKIMLTILTDTTAIYMQDYRLPINISYDFISQDIMQIDLYNNDDLVFSSNTAISDTIVKLNPLSNEIYLNIKFEDGSTYNSNFLMIQSKRSRKVFSTYSSLSRMDIFQNSKGNYIATFKHDLGALLLEANTQGTFERYKVFEDQHRAYIDQLDNGDYIMCTGGCGDSNIGRVQIINSYFNTKKKWEVNGTGYILSNSISCINNNVIVGWKETWGNFNPTYEYFLWHLDLNTDIVDIKVFPDMILNIDKSSNNFVLGFSGYKYMAKIDDNFNEIWSKYAQDGYGNGYYISAQENGNIAVMPEDYQISVFNSDGSVISNFDYLENGAIDLSSYGGHHIAHNIICSHNHVYVVFATQKSYENPVQTKEMLTALKFDFYGNLIWKTKCYTGDTHPMACSSKDGGIFIISKRKVDGDTYLYSHKISEDGEFFW